jgi:AcrR family transcriptional regulator
MGGRVAEATKPRQDVGEPAPVRRMHDPEATREALVRAATRLFAAVGFDGTTVEQIAAASGVNKAMINYHFGGKDGLYTSILRESFTRLASEVARLRARPGSADQALRELIATLGRMMTETPSLPAMMLREILAGGGRLDDGLVAQMLSVFGATREIVERGVRTRRFRRVDPVLTHLGLIGSLLFYFATAPFRDRKVAAGRLPEALATPPTPERFIAHLQDLTARGLAAEPAARRAGR